MNSHGNNLFGFNQESVIGSFSPMASELKASEGTNTIIGDPITQNFGGGPLPKGFPSWSRQAGSDSDEYADMSGWKTFWQSTFAPKKYKENRLNEARASVDRKYSLNIFLKIIGKYKKIKKYILKRILKKEKYITHKYLCSI